MFRPQQALGVTLQRFKQIHGFPIWRQTLSTSIVGVARFVRLECSGIRSHPGLRPAVIHGRRNTPEPVDFPATRIANNFVWYQPPWLLFPFLFHMAPSLAGVFLHYRKVFRSCIVPKLPKKATQILASKTIMRSPRYSHKILPQYPGTDTPAPPRTQRRNRQLCVRFSGKSAPYKRGQ